MNTNILILVIWTQQNSSPGRTCSGEWGKKIKINFYFPPLRRHYNRFCNSLS